MNISTVLLLEDVGDNYQVVVEFNVTAEPGRDSCLPGSSDRQCCVTRNLAAESQFGVNSSYLYGVVELPGGPGGPNMIETHGARVSTIGQDGYQFPTSVYKTMRDSALRNRHNLRLQASKMFQFIIGKCICSLIFANESHHVFTIILLVFCFREAP